MIRSILTILLLACAILLAEILWKNFGWWAVCLAGLGVVFILLWFLVGEFVKYTHRGGE